MICHIQYTPSKIIIRMVDVRWLIHIDLNETSAWFPFMFRCNIRNSHHRIITQLWWFPFFQKSHFIQPLLESRLFYRNILGGRSVVWPQHKIGWDTWGRGLEEGWEMFSFLESSHIANHFPIHLLKSRLIGMGKNIFFLGMFPCCLILWYLFCPNNVNWFFEWSSTSFPLYIRLERDAN